jgi:trk system potassium uptake protein TrkH
LNWTLILKTIGGLLIFLAASMLAPLGWAIYYGDGDAWVFVVAIVINAVVGIILRFLFRTTADFGIREGFAVVTFGWVSAVLFSAVPFYITGALGGFTNAFFETMSGFTTTGASILTDIESLPHGLLFWRSMTHWLGGMGIIVLFLAVLPLLGVGGVQLFRAEAPGPVDEKLTPRIKETARLLWMVYVALSALETVLLMFGGMDLFDAMCQTFGTMATGGFSTRNASIAAFNSAYIDYVIVVFMFLAGTNFALHFRVITGRVFGYFRNVEFLGYLGFVVVATVVVLFLTRLNVYDNLADALRYSLFQVVAIGTTTGYATADFELWPALTQIVLVLLMVVGGMSGSTGGGLKVYRIMVSFKHANTCLRKLVHPHAVIPVRMGRVAVSDGLVSNIVGLVQIYIILFLVASLVMAGLGLDLVSAPVSVIACLSNIGPGLGSVGPTDNYAHIPVIGKWVLIGCMLLGRLEIYTVLIVVTRSFWKK